MKKPPLSLLQKAILAVIALFLPVTMAFIHGYNRNREYLKEQDLRDIATIAEAFEGQVYQFIELSRHHTLELTSDDFIKGRLKKIISGDGSAVHELNEYLTRKLPHYKTTSSIMILSLEGRVLSSTSGQFMGRDLSKEPFFKKGKGGMNVTEQKEEGLPELAISAPIHDGHTGEQMGVAVSFIRLSELSRVLSGESRREHGAIPETKGRRETMEVYLVNRDRLMLTESRFIKDAALNQKVDTTPVQECLMANREVAGFYRDYRGVMVAGASMCMPEMKWTLIAEIDEDEVLTPVSEVRRNTVTASAFVVGLTFTLLALFLRRVVRPLKRISIASGEMASGNYDITIPVETGDEIGALADSFNRMARETKKNVMAIRDADEALRMEQQLFIGGPIVVFKWKAQEGWPVEYVSPNVVNQLGYSQEDFTGGKVPYADIIHPDDLARVAAEVKHYSEAGVPTFEQEYRMARKDGRYRWLYDFTRVIRDHQGAITHYHGYLLDITERKEAEEEIRRNYDIQSAVASVLRHSVEPVSLTTQLELVLDMILSIPWLTLQQKGCIFLIEEDPDVLVMKAQRGFPEEIQAACARVPIGKCICGRAAAMGEIQFINWTDDRHEIRYPGMLPHGHYCLPIHSGKKVIGVINVYTEEGHRRDPKEEGFLSTICHTLAGIIERKRAEEDLRKSEARFRQVVESNMIGIIFGDINGNITDANDIFLKMLGYTREELLSEGLNWMDMTPQEYRHLDEKALDELEVKGVCTPFEKEFIRKDGSRIPILLGAALLEGYRDRGVCFTLDLTERTRLEEQFRQAQKMEGIGHLAGGIAHDFNNILTAMISYGHLLIQKKGGDELVKNYAEQILTLSDRAANLTQGLLVFSRRQAINLQVRDLNEIIRRVGKILARVIREDIELKTDLADKGLKVKVDSTQIEQVLMNLATNARDAMPKGGKLIIGTSLMEMDNELISTNGYGKPGLYALITFADTGTGMDEETKKRIFEPFFTTKEVGKGTGLGLSTVYGIIKQHDGYINVDSELDKGTVFKIYLPLTEEPAKELRPIEVAPPKGGKETVLLAEDDEEVRKITKIILEESGYGS